MSNLNLQETLAATAISPEEIFEELAAITVLANQPEGLPEIVERFLAVEPSDFGLIEFWATMQERGQNSLISFVEELENLQNA